MLHGMFLFICVLTIPGVLNMIPLATLACILFVVGYKLAKPSLFVSMYRLGLSQFIPFIVTVAGIVFTDLLKGIGIGMAVAIFYLLRNHYRNAYSLEHVPGKSDVNVPVKMMLAEEASFLNKGSILKTLNDLKPGSSIVIDASKSKVVDMDVIEVIRDFTVNAKRRNIIVDVVGIPITQGTENHGITEVIRK
jgi:SulP family sulfate permease